VTLANRKQKLPARKIIGSPLEIIEKKNAKGQKGNEINQIILVDVTPTKFATETHSIVF
jgi:hypothetical protein